MKKLSSKSCSVVLALLIMFNCFSITAYASDSATTMSSFTLNENTDFTPLSVPPDEEIIDVKIVPLLNSSTTRSADFIVFVFTRNIVQWQLVGFPDIRNWHFSGSARITNLTSGLYDSMDLPMIGTSGTFTYSGYNENQYLLSFDGNLFFTAHGTMELTESCSGGHVWRVPFN